MPMRKVSQGPQPFADRSRKKYLTHLDADENQ